MTVERQQLQRNFTRAAARYDVLATYQHDLMRRAGEWALDVFPERATLLDIGAGTGLYAGEAQTMRPQWHVVCLDLSPGMCDAAAERSSLVVQSDAESLPVAGGSLDGIFSSLCLQWVNDKQAAFREIARVLKPGGQAVVVTLAHESLRELRTLSGSGDLGLLPMEPVETYRALAQGAGLEIVREQSKIETRHYASVYGLLNSMRTIGAGNALAGRRDSLAPRHRINRIIAEYERRYTLADGVFASWQPVFLILKKTAAS